jgi:RAB protein geranylgeranyltransferase component A
MLGNKLNVIPTSKTDVWKSDLLSLPEKRLMIQFIEQCLYLNDKELMAHANVNSLHVYEISLTALNDYEKNEIEGCIMIRMERKATY